MRCGVLGPDPPRVLRDTVDRAVHVGVPVVPSVRVLAVLGGVVPAGVIKGDVVPLVNHIPDAGAVCHVLSLALPALVRPDDLATVLNRSNYTGFGYPGPDLKIMAVDRVDCLASARRRECPSVGLVPLCAGADALVVDVKIVLVIDLDKGVA